MFHIYNIILLNSLDILIQAFVLLINHTKICQMQVETGELKPIQLLRKSYQKMTNQFSRACQQKDEIQSLMKFEKNRAQEAMNIQKTCYENQINDLIRRVRDLQANCKRLQSEENDKNRKEIRKYVETVNQKDAEINNLKREINTIKKKFAGQEQEIDSLNNIKQNYQIFVLKSVEQIKLSIKQTYSCIEDAENEKMVLESKFRQLNEKNSLLEIQLNQLDSKKLYLQQSYEKLKSLYKGVRQQNLDLKFQLQKMRQNARQRGQPTISFQKNYEEQEECFITKQLQSISQIKAVLQDCQSYLKQTNMFCQMNKQLTNDNNSLKNRINDLEAQINQLKCKYISEHEDQYLRQKQPSVYDYLLKKKEQFAHFQKLIQKIQSRLESKDDQINKILTIMLEKEERCNCGKQEQLNRIKEDYDLLLKKNQVLCQNIHKSKNQCNGLQTKINAYKEQLKDFVAPKKGKTRKPGRARCPECLISIEKNQSQKCADCSKLFHQVNCMRSHTCGKYLLQDNNSSMSID